MSGRIIVASNRLPLSVVEREGKLVADRSIGGLATAMAMVFEKHKPYWVGWTGLRRRLNSEELKSLNLPKTIIPVQLEADLIEHYYDQVANRVLWPTLHNLLLADSGFQASWPAYKEVADHFVAAMAPIVRPKDMIWIHDYHLFLLPERLRQAGLNNRLGFFLHTPFPPPEHLLTLPFANEILASLCQVDVLGLQTQRDVDNFWACLKAVGLKQQPGLVRAFPIGVDWQSHAQAALSRSVKARKSAVLKKEAKRRTILSISRLDYTKGILMQLQAVETFLKANPAREQFVYELRVAPSRESVPEYADLKKAIERAVKRINRSLGNKRWQPIDYAYENLDFEGMNAYYLTADVLLLTPIIDGMNLIAKEYVAARADDKSMLVLGDQIGAAFQLTDAVLVNAQDKHDIARGLAEALAMSPAEKTRRWAGLRRAVQGRDVFWWAESFLKALSGR